jgi:uroporphyrinogen decarboxylase
MTPKERAIAAFSLQQPDKVPTMEIDFQLHKELLGKSLILGKQLGKLAGKEKEAALQHNAEIYKEFLGFSEEKLEELNAKGVI